MFQSEQHASHFCCTRERQDVGTKARNVWGHCEQAVLYELQSGWCERGEDLNLLCARPACDANQFLTTGSAPLFAPARTKHMRACAFIKAEM